MKLFYYFILVLLFVWFSYDRAQFVLPPVNLDEYDAYGSLLAMNEYLAVLAQNDQEEFTIITYPFTNQSQTCTIRYDTVKLNLTSLTRFVYSVAIGTKQNVNQLYFSYVDENWQRDLFLTIVFLQLTDNRCVRVINRIGVNITDLGMKEQALAGMDPYGKRAYAMGAYYIVCIEIETGAEWQLPTKTLYNNQSNIEHFFFPKAFVITENDCIFAVGQRFANLQFLPYLIILDFLLLENVTVLSSELLSRFNFGPSSTNITRSSTMSLSLLDQSDRFIIGIPSLDMLLLMSWNFTNINQQPAIVRRFNSSQSGVSFGKSVALLNYNTFAVLAYALPTLPWSTSQVQVYSFSANDSDNSPLLIYPNNQQIIPSLNDVPPPHSILTIVSWNSHLGLVLDAGVALLLSASPPGYSSTQIDDHVSGIRVYTSVSCIPGTARNITSFGPCFLCPPGTKNNGSSRVECETCVTDSSRLCLRGSSVEIPLTDVSDYNQATPYPDSPELVSFDDILLQNIFRFEADSPYCLINSPLFWTTLALGLAFLMLVVIGILGFFPRWKPQRTFLKKLLTHLDLIGEGEMWLGGLLTFAIVILLVFTCKFSISFARLYPIEAVPSNTQLTVSCDSVLPNTKFSSTLQLLSMVQSEEEKLIFTMLDEQNITLTVHFVGTAFLCDSVMVQQNSYRGQKIQADRFNCSFANETNILSISTLLPADFVTMQFDLVGPHFIGGLRICFSGLADTEADDTYILQELRFCQFFYTNNQTLTIKPIVEVKMTKIVNRTIGYTVSEDKTFSGIWIPTLTVGTLSDVLLLNESGEHTRYLSDRVTLMVDISESEFFLKNTQEPIARHYEIVLRTILFGIVFLELFGLFFLLVKLTIIPLVQFLQRRFRSHKTWSLKDNTEQKQHTPTVQRRVKKESKYRQTNREHDDDDLVSTIL